MKTIIRKRRPVTAVATAAMLALVVAACGSSSTSSSSSIGTTAATPAAGGGARRAQIAACLRKQGIAPPQRRPGGAPPGEGLGFGGPPGGGGDLGRFRAALAKCGIRPRGGRGGFLARNPQARQALQRFVACVRRNGFDLPAPNLSGNGPIFDPAKVNRNDPKLLAATRKCQSLLPQRRRLGPGAPPSGGPA